MRRAHQIFRYTCEEPSLGGGGGIMQIHDQESIVIPWISDVKDIMWKRCRADKRSVNIGEIDRLQKWHGLARNPFIFQEVRERGRNEEIHPVTSCRAR